MLEISQNSRYFRISIVIVKCFTFVPKCAGKSLEGFLYRWLHSFKANGKKRLKSLTAFI